MLLGNVVYHLLYFELGLISTLHKLPFHLFSIVYVILLIGTSALMWSRQTQTDVEQKIS